MSDTRGGRRRDTRALGRRGEQIAAEYLLRRGVRIVARNVHMREAEIDLIGLEGTTLCFVEVRLRRSARFGSPAASVDARKRRRITRAARAWLASGRAPRYQVLRFDVVAIDASREPPRVEHYRDAFTAS